MSISPPLSRRFANDSPDTVSSESAGGAEHLPSSLLFCSLHPCEWTQTCCVFPRWNIFMQPFQSRLHLGICMLAPWVAERGSQSLWALCQPLGLFSLVKVDEESPCTRRSVRFRNSEMSSKSGGEKPTSLHCDRELNLETCPAFNLRGQGRRPGRTYAWVGS